MKKALLVCFFAFALSAFSHGGEGAGDKSGISQDLFIVKGKPSAGEAEAAAGWNIYLSQGKLAEAAEKFRAAQAKDPSGISGPFGLSNVLCDQGLYREAGLATMAALKNSAQSPWFEINCADAKSLLDFAEKPEALANMLKELLAQPDSMPLLNQLFCHHLYYQALLRTGQEKEAIAEASTLPYIREWLLLGPFDNREKGGFDNSSGREELEKSLASPDLSKEYDGRSGKLRWFQLKNVPAKGLVNLSALLHPASESLAYLTTRVMAEEDCEASLIIGASGRADIFHDNIKLAGWSEYQAEYYAFQRVLPLRLHKGANWISLKIGGDMDNSLAFSAMILPVSREALDNPAPALPSGKIAVNLQGLEQQPAKDKQADASAAAQEKKGGEAKLDDGLSFGLMGHLRRALGQDQENGMARIFTGTLMIYRGLDDDLHQATRPLLEKCVAQYPSCPLALVLSAQTQTDANVHRALLRRAMAADPGAVMATEMLIDNLAEAGLEHDAEELCASTLAKRPSSSALQTLTSIQKKRKWTAEAEASLRQALAISPNDEDIILALSNAVVSETEREAILRKGLSTGSDEIKRRLAHLLLDKASVPGKDVASLAQSNLAISPYDSDDWFLLEDCALKDGDLKQAEEVLTQAASALPQAPNIREELGNIKLQLGKKDEAAAAWRQALAIDAENPDLTRHLREIEPKTEDFYSPYEIRTEELLANLPTQDKYPRFSTAVLLDEGVVRMYNNGTHASYTHFVRVALSPQGVKEVSQRSIPYMPDREKLTVLAARVLASDGAVISSAKVTDNNHSSGPQGAGAVYSQGHTKDIYFNQVKPGDIIELKYVIEPTGENLCGNVFDDGFFIGGDSPTLHFRYVLETAEGRQVAVKTANAEKTGVKLEESTRAGYQVRSWTAQDIPGIEHEPNMPPFDEIAPIINETTFTTWDEVGKWYWNMCKDALVIPDDIRAQVRELTKDAKTAQEKIAIIHRKVIEDIRYVGIELGRNGYVPHSAERTWRSHYGDCKDTAVLFCALLAAVDIPAKVALVRTRMRGIEPTGLPGANRFDHAICYIPEIEGRDYWLDGTTDHNNLMELPAMDQGALAVITGPDEARQVTIPEDPPEANLSENTYTFTLDKDGSAKVEATFVYRGANAPLQRNLFQAPERFTKNVGEFIKRRFPGAKVDEIKPGSADISNLTPTLAMSFTIPKLAKKENGNLSFSPYAMPQMMSQRNTKQDTRVHDLVLGIKSCSRLTVNIILPEGAQANNLPAPVAENTPFGSIKRECKAEGDKITLTQECILSTRRIKVDDYQKFRAFCAAVDTAEEAQIVYGDK